MKYTILLFFSLTILLNACNKAEEDKDEAHIWQHQTDTIEDAKAVQQKLNEESERTQKQLEQTE